MSHSSSPPTACSSSARLRPHLLAERVRGACPDAADAPCPSSRPATGLVGPDATTGERRVVTWRPDEDDPEWQMSLDSTDDEVAAFAERLEEAYERRRGAALVLGRAPGVVVDAFRSDEGHPRAAVDYARAGEARPPRGTPPRDMAVILGSHVGRGRVGSSVGGVIRSGAAENRGRVGGEAPEFQEVGREPGRHLCTPREPTRWTTTRLGAARRRRGRRREEGRSGHGRFAIRAGGGGGGGGGGSRPPYPRWAAADSPRSVRVVIADVGESFAHGRGRRDARSVSRRAARARRRRRVVHAAVARHRRARSVGPRGRAAARDAGEPTPVRERRDAPPNAANAANDSPESSGSGSGDSSRTWMPSKAERGLSGKDLATHLRRVRVRRGRSRSADAADDSSVPGTASRANPSRRARASARMNERHLYGDQLTAPRRITVHSVFGHDHRSMLVQGHGIVERSILLPNPGREAALDPREKRWRRSPRTRAWGVSRSVR